jgi:hypothetical protein
VLIHSRNTRACKYLLDNASAEQRKGALRHGFAYGAGYRCVYSGLNLMIPVGGSPGI